VSRVLGVPSYLADVLSTSVFVLLSLFVAVGYLSVGTVTLGTYYSQRAPKVSLIGPKTKA
jgi:hypothetical protein